MRRPSLAALIGSLLVATIAFADAPVKIGVLTDLSGPGSYYGHQTRAGAVLALRELRAEGKPITVIFEDSALHVPRALSAAQKLIFIDKVDALYVDFTVISTAVSSLALNNKKLMLYAAAAESITKQNPYAFKSYSDYNRGGEALAREFKRKGVVRLGVLKAESEYGELCFEGARRVFPDAIEHSYRQGEKVSSQMLLFRNSKTEAIINCSFEGDVLNSLRAAAEMNYRVWIGAAEDTFTQRIRDQFGAILDGSVSFGLQSPASSLINRINSVEGVDTLSGYEGAGLGYLHIKQLYNALQECTERQVECVVRNLSASAANSLVGFERWSNRVAQLRVVIKEFHGGDLKEVDSYLSGAAALGIKH